MFSVYLAIASITIVIALWPRERDAVPRTLDLTPIRRRL